MAEPGAGQRVVAKAGSTVLQAGRDVISGNVFVGRFARLRDVWLDPAPVFDEVGVDQFVGREWLADAIDRFMRGRDRGYVVVEASAGLGKTAFAAWISRRRGWPCHFTRRRKGRLSAVALRNLAAQLIARYDLAEQFAPGGMLPETASEPGWFDHVLRAARTAAEGERIVLVIDGLDEAEHVDGDLPLGLPSTLPSGVFLIITCRVGTDLSALRQPWQALSIEAGDRRNTADLHRYLTTIARDQPLASVLDESGVSADVFAKRLAHQCGGVWVYLRYVLEELRLGLRRVDDLDRLPVDLVHYYLESLGASSDRTGWTALRLPVLATLAAIAEPVPVDTLTRMAGLRCEQDIAGLCHGRLRPFLTTTAAAGEVLYGIYHASLREFMTNGPADHDLDTLRTTTRELATATRQAHDRIANQYLATFGGLSDSLPTLGNDPTLATADRHYPRRHLAFHLEHAGRVDDLHRLMDLEHGSRNLWFDVHDHAGQLSEYLDDLRRARRLSGQDTDAQFHTGVPATALGRELHYTIVIATVTALTAHVPVPLLLRMVATGQWSVARAVEHARSLHDPGTRSHALTGLVELLPPAERPAIATEALAAARASVDGQEQLWLLRRIRPRLGPDDQDRVLTQMRDAAAALPETTSRAAALFEVGLDLPEPQRQHVLQQSIVMADTITDEAERTNVLAEMARRAPDYLVDQVLTATAGIDYGDDKAFMLAVLALRLREHQLPAAIAIANTIEAPDLRSWAIGALAGVASADRDRLVAEAEQDARAVADTGDRAWALCTLAEVVDGGHRSELLDAALSSARELRHSTPLRARRLGDIARLLDGEARKVVHDDALFTAHGIKHTPTRCRVQYELSDLFDELEDDRSRRDALLSEILSEARQLDDDDVVNLISRMAPTLPASLFPQVLAMVGALSDQYQRGWLLGAITEYLPSDLVTEALAAARTVSHEFGRTQLLGEIMARLPHTAGDYATVALASAEAISSTYYRALAFVDLAINQPGQRASRFARALATTRATNGFDRIRVTKRLTEHLAPAALAELIAETLAEARGLRDPADRARGLALLMPHLQEDVRATVLSEAIAATHAVVPDYLRGVMLAFLAAMCSGAQQEELLDAAFTTLQGLPATGVPMEKFARRSARLARFLPRRRVLELVDVLNDAANFDEHARTPVTAKAAPFLRWIPEKLIVDGISALHTLPASLNITPELAAIAIHLPAHLRDQALTEALTPARQTRVARRRALRQAQHVRETAPTADDLALLRRCLETVELNDCLSVLAAAVPTIHELADDDTLRRVVQSVTTVERWWYPTSSQ